MPRVGGCTLPYGRDYGVQGFPYLSREEDRISGLPWRTPFECAMVTSSLKIKKFNSLASRRRSQRRISHGGFPLEHDFPYDEVAQDLLGD